MYATSSSPSPESQREQAKDRAAIGPFNARAAALFIVTGVSLFAYFRWEKQAVEARKKAETAQAKVGRPKIGGDFQLVMPAPIPSASSSAQVPPPVSSGHMVTADDLKGSFSIIYFGFTNCPDICPEMLDALTDIVNKVDSKHGPIINPVFITCDPARDTLQKTAIYTSEFHPRMLGLTGDYEQVKAACKAYRVYFSTPPGADPNGDYLVDHSIFMFLMDPDGKFVEAFGKAGITDVGSKVLGFVEKWKEAGLPIAPADLKERILKDKSRQIVDK